MRASGRPALHASTAGMPMTASPNQLLERMSKRNGSSVETSCPGGKWHPRFHLRPRKRGHGVFQRLCSQNQSLAEAVIWRSRMRFNCAVSSPTVLPCGATGGSMVQRQRAGPIVWIATEMSGAPVRSDKIAASGEVEASLPKNGVQIPPSPACWSMSTARMPPPSTRSTAPM